MDGQDLDGIPTFAKRIKEKYPQYADLDDNELTERVVRKHPVYASKVKMPDNFRLLQTSSGYQKIDDIYEQAGRAHNVDPNLLLEQGRQETISFKPEVMYGRLNSSKGARGAGQFMKGTAPTYGLRVDDEVDERTDPVKSINAQARYMRKLLDDFDNDESLALAGYNAGEYRDSLRNGQIPKIKETQDYVSIITGKLASARKNKSLQNPFTVSSFSPDQSTQSFVNPDDLPKVSLGDLPAEMFKPPVPSMSPKQTDIPITLPKPQGFTGNLKTLNQQNPDLQGEQLPLSNMPKPEELNKMLPPFEIPKPENRQQLPQDYLEFLKHSNLTDSPESKNLYSQTVLQPLAETEKAQNAQYEKSFENYNQNLDRQIPNVQQNQIAPENQAVQPSTAYELPKDESRTTTIDQRTLDPKNELAEDSKARRTVAGVVNVDMSQKPKGVALDEWLFTIALDQIGSKYNLTPEQKAAAANAFKSERGQYLQNNYLDVTDENYQQFLEQYKSQFGDTFNPITLSRNVINAALTGSTTSPLSEAVRRDLQTEQADRNLDFATSDTPVGKDEFGNTLTSRDSSALQGRRNDEQSKRERNSDYALRQDIIERLRADRADNPLYASPEPTEQEIEREIGYYKLAQQDYANAQTEAEALEKVPVIGSLLAGAIGSGGRTAKSVSGIMRPFQGLFQGTADIISRNSSPDGWINSVVNNGFFTKLKFTSDNALIVEQTTNPNNYGSEALKVVGALPGDISRLIVLSKLPGGSVTGFALDSGLQSAGRGEDVGEVLKHTAKGAALGSLFKLSGSVGNLVNNPLLKTVAKVGTVGVGAYPVERIFGATPEEAFKASLMNGLFELAGSVGSLKGKTLRVWEKGKAREVKVENDGNVLLLEGLEKSPVDLEMVLDPKDNVYKPKARNENVSRETFADDSGAIDADIEYKTPKQSENSIVKSEVNLTPETDLLANNEVQQTPQIEQKSDVKTGLQSNETPFADIKKSLSEIPDIEQPNIRTEVSRKIVNDYRRFYGRDEYTGDLSKLLGALEDANGYHASEVLSRLSKPRSAADYVANLVNEAEVISSKKTENLPKSEIESQIKPLTDVQTDKQNVQTDSQSPANMALADVQTVKPKSATELIDNTGEIYEDLPAVLHKNAKSVPPFDEMKNFSVETNDGVLVVNDAKLKDYFKENNLGYYDRNKAVWIIEKGKLNVSDIIQPENSPLAETTRKPFDNESLTGKTVITPDGKTGTVIKEVGKSSVAIRLQNEKSVVQTFKNKLEVVEEMPQSTSETVANTPALLSANDAAHEAATSPFNDLPEPTKAQVEAGNYKMGHQRIGGLDLTIEIPKGGKRKGTDKNGNDWERELEHHYGYIKRSVGADNENIDIFLNEGTPENFDGNVYIVNQQKQNGEFDEHKAMIGYESEASARSAYLSNYPKDWNGLKSIGSMSMPKFKSWVRDGKKGVPVENVNAIEATGAFRTSSNAENLPQQQSLWLPDSPKKTTTRELDANRLTELDKKRADSIVSEYEKVSGKSPAELYEKAAIKFELGNLYVNAEATELLRHADYVAFKDADSFAYFGRYLNPSNAARIENALKMNFGAGKPQSISIRYKKKQFLAEFEKARKASALGDVRQIVTSKTAPYGLKAARQEETAHAKDYSVGLEHRAAVGAFKFDPVGRRAMRVVKNSGYEKFSDDGIAREVSAKIWTDTATTDLKLSADKINYLRDLYINSLLDKGKTFSGITSEFRQVSKSSRNYLQENQLKYEQQSGTERTDETTQLARPGGYGDSRTFGTTDSGRTGKVLEKVSRTGERAKSKLGELDLYERKFIESKTKGNTELAEKVADEILYSRSKSNDKMTVGDYVLDIANGIPRALKSTLDWSAPGRQGWILTLSNPVAGAKSFKQQILSFFSASAHKKFADSIDDHPLIDAMEGTGLYLANRADKSDLNQREEQFTSRILGDEKLFSNEKLEAFRQGLTYPVRWSERAFNDYLDKIRIESYLHFAKQVFDYNERKGITDNETYQKQLEAVSKFINSATGRGSLGRLEDHAAILNLPFFSVRNWKSRLDVINPAFYAAMPPGARGAALQSFGTFAGATALAFFLLSKSGIADIETDIDSPDFLKVRIGQYRFDISAAIVSQVRYVAQMAKSAYNLDAQDAAKTSMNYVRGKLSPTLGAIVSTATGTKISNEPTSAGKEAQGLVIPISIEQLTSAAKRDGTLGALLASPDLLGFGVSRYENSQEIGFQLAELERQLAKTRKDSAEEKELTKQVKVWRDYYNQARMQPGELPFYMQKSDFDDNDKKDDKEETTVIYSDEKPKMKPLDLNEKIEFYKKNKDTLFSFAKDELESIILQDAENLRLRGRLSKALESSIKTIIPEWSPIRENQPGVDLRPEKLPKIPGESLPKLPKRPKLPPIPASR